DLVPGWVSHPDQPFFKSYREQSEDARRELDTRMYDIIGTLSQLGFRADRYDRVRDFMRTVAIVPVSAKTGEGIPDLIAVLVGLTQQYLTERLRTTEGPAKGTVLEVKEEVGLGTTLNAIIYDGVLRKGDTIVVGGKEKPIVTRVKALLLPQPLDEMRDPRKRFIQVEEVTAAAGVKIVAPGLEDALAGSPVVVVPEEGDVDEVVREVVEEVESVKVSTDKVGVVVKADTLGSLEAIVAGLRRRGIPVRMGDIGDVSKRDVVEAATVGLKEPLYGVILAFNVKVLPDAEEEAYERGVRIFSDRIIYNLMDGYVKWLESKRTERERREFESLVKPGKIRVLSGYVFRRAKPAIFGVEVLSGRIKPRYELVRKDGKNLGRISQIQEMGKPISEATAGMQVAISMPKPVVGRHVREGDVLYVRVPEAHARRLLEKFSHMLSEDELETLKEYLRMLKEEKMERLGM
ncbi:MAG TPA: translation initiation factor IF-2, partial [Candidatus Bathyarchaeota archaeon]|nr:translation initiation factor IF-2 [Candidatus Bathyarchaeota archaeon]